MASAEQRQLALKVQDLVHNLQTELALMTREVLYAEVENPIVWSRVFSRMERATRTLDRITRALRDGEEDGL